MPYFIRDKMAVHLAWANIMWVLFTHIFSRFTLNEIVSHWREQLAYSSRLLHKPFTVGKISNFRKNLRYKIDFKKIARTCLIYKKLYFLNRSSNSSIAARNAKHKCDFSGSTFLFPSEKKRMWFCSLMAKLCCWAPSLAIEWV